MSLNEVIKNFEKAGTNSCEFKKVWDLYLSIVEQTRRYVNQAGFTDVVIGLSGGIDSTLVSKIAVDALGPNHVHGIIMPGPFSSQDSIGDSLRLAESLGVSTCVLTIDKPVKMFESELVSNGYKVSDLTKQNLQARSRMIYLMAVSNEQGFMVLNTGNKSEAYTGYSTLYGDMVGAFAPIGDVYKTDVFKICCAINMNAGCEVIPKNIIAKPPSAELSDGQTDEASLGINYVDLDNILKMILDEKLDDVEIRKMGYLQSQIQLVRNKIKNSAFKRSYEPPCAKADSVE